MNLGNLHFIENDFSAAVNEYEKAEGLDPRLAIAFYNHSVASGEAFRFEDVESETLMLGGFPVRIATPRMLYRMKKDTLRPIDHADAADLKAKFALRDD